ncbi:2-succinyl-5-enolpyruvyl-6-hydroxy-3-cyclohexene-1-carboxylic-acid synthase [Shewanella litorisediminis]|uniref:2-succinyl-5-enolpyruvyl-6-hydroxy-3-cyclohexene-1-carboxylate synthase n=1 Tax=Shewanella litorisediminis TaxID=1173586 RepID=A0ABX7G356_9GAMM|nr:2-succinyl-5-enolpyruvyl-6-hydroxy-3-cyclohexene-1-carboxylic-acid synthase [Shewanella litorisediminis]MCL2917197.1 2-succinyl-5-enolpyruvyl-6-hydroxy-3-cyclohexene-1-carboxylic-acid synthase [Shewanella litorisediminis]QRH01672.1 2-succinyl-5-enolpyruvyl-6-hydroxy-3-cyclohexene-1-carboxylic-acid synthase [Shewanella litorisediminis]
MDHLHSSTAELNLLWGSLILEELTRHGVMHLCMAPGSRSTPLTLAAAAQDKLTRHLHFDERGLGFLALGLAKASKAPVAIITTSGTAVANLYPAIVEASLTHVPLIILSGDRPWELIGCGANQAIDQPGIFGSYARQLNLPTPDLRIGPEVLLSALDEKLANLDRPLHINCMYPEPLYPSDHRFEQFDGYLSRLGQWQDTQAPYLSVANANLSAFPPRDAMMRFVHGKGVIVAGTLTEAEAPTELITLSQKLGWPLLTDAQSQLRQHPGAIGHIDQLLLNPRARALLDQAERVLVFGGRLLSKRLISYLAEKDWHSYWQVLPHQERLDPSHSNKQLWLGRAGDLCSLDWPRSSEANWAAQLITLNQSVEQDFIHHIDGGEFGEAQVIRAIAASHTAEQQLFIGNSLPVRLYDMFAPIGCCAASTYTNRGASGIDGLIATACGVARHQGRPTTLILGDLSALHDLNSLALARDCQSPLVIVVLNNDGGNIFNLLPVPTEELRSHFYRLSHGLEFGYGAAMFGLPYDRAEDMEAFIDAYQAALEHPGASVIEVTVAQDQASNQIRRMAEWIRSR